MQSVQNVFDLFVKVYNKGWAAGFEHGFLLGSLTVLVLLLVTVYFKRKCNA